MSCTYKFALEPSTNEVRSIMFSRCLTDGDYTVHVHRKHIPEVQDRRVQDWTREQIQAEFNICNESVDFNALLRKRMAVKKHRGNKMAVITTNSQEL